MLLFDEKSASVLQNSMNRDDLSIKLAIIATKGFFEQNS